MTTDPIVHIVDDDDDLRTAFLEMYRESGYQAFTYPSAEHFLQTSLDSSINCLILDIRMSGMSGLQLFDELTQKRWYIPVIFLTGNGTVPTAIEAIRKGAFDFLEKPIDNAILLAKTKAALQACQQQNKIIETLEKLTNREAEVLQLLAEGYSSKAIAAKLGISVSTSVFHRQNIKKKTKSNSVSDLVQLSNLDLSRPFHRTP